MTTHVRAIIQEWLAHILGLFGTDITNIKLGLDEENTKTLFVFVGTFIGELVNLEWPHELDATIITTLIRTNKRLLRNIHAWVIWVETTFLGINSSMLYMDDYDSYLILRNMATIVLITPTTVAPLQIQIPPTPTYSQYIPPTSFMPNVKFYVNITLCSMVMEHLGLSSREVSCQLHSLMA